MLLILRIFFVCFGSLLLWNGLLITSGGVEILYISGVMFRVVFLWEIYYYLLEYFVPWLYEKLSCSIFRLFSIKK